MSAKFGQTVDTIDLASSDEEGNAPDDQANNDDDSDKLSRDSRCPSIQSDSEKTSYKCLLCNDEFEEQDSLHNHIATHGSPDCHKCNECGKLFARIASLQAHTERHLRTNPNAFSNSPAKDVTSRGKRRKPKQCQSREVHSGSHEMTTDARSKTSQTAEKPRSSVNLFSTDDIHIGPLMCTFCKKIFKTQEQLCLHVAANHAIKNAPEQAAPSNAQPKKKFIECNKCGQLFNSKEGLNQHDLVIHKSTEFHTCSICDSSFNTLSNLLKHVTAHKNELISSSSRSSVEEDDDIKGGSLVCPMCGKYFRDDNIFQKHLDSHDANSSKQGPRMTCGICRDKFFNPLLLKEHIAQNHSGSDSPRNSVIGKVRDSRRSSSLTPKSPIAEVQVRAMQPCVICTEDGRKMHKSSPVKSMSCAGCAQFFVTNLRMLIFAGKLKCDRKGKCLITSNVTESCPPCHLRVCITTFPVLGKLESKALAIKRLDSVRVDHVFSILSSQCLHQTNCKRFMNALDELENAKGIATKRSSVSSSDSEAHNCKKVKKEIEGETDQAVLYINENDDDVICIDDNGEDETDDSKIEESSSLLKDIRSASPVEADDATAKCVPQPTTASNVSQEKSQPKPSGLAKKRTKPGKRPRSTSAAGSDAGSVAGEIVTGNKEDNEQLSRTTSAEVDLQSATDHSESLDRSGLGLDDHLVTLFHKMADWAKPVFWMWTLVPFDLGRLKEYNTKQAEIAPYCSICQLFINDESKCPEMSHVEVDDPGAEEKIKFTLSVPVMPKALYRSEPFKCRPNKKKSPEPVIKEEPENATVLVTCAVCSVRVHAKCYGIDMEEGLKEWRCAICEHERFDAECCLCFMRGGALQATTDGRWCHIVCALGIPEVFFVDVEARKPINVRCISNERKRLICRHCSTWTRDMRRGGTCAQCWDSTRCCAPLHVTCGKAAGDIFNCRHDDSRIPVYIICRRHTQKQKKSVRLKMPKVETGQLVIAKAKNGRYYKATVKAQFMEIFYEVDFQDGTVSKDLYPEDIKDGNCRETGPPPIGSAVKVIWTDKKPYSGVFLGVNHSIVYKVEFEDTSVVKLKREEFYADGESLPEEVCKKLSTATPSKFDFDLVFARPPEEPRPRCSHYPS